MRTLKKASVLALALVISGSMFSMKATAKPMEDNNIKTASTINMMRASKVSSDYVKLRILASDNSINVKWNPSTKSITFSGPAMQGLKTLSLSYLERNYNAYLDTDGYIYMYREDFANLMFFEFDIQ